LEEEAGLELVLILPREALEGRQMSPEEALLLLPEALEITEMPVHLQEEVELEEEIHQEETAEVLPEVMQELEATMREAEREEAMVDMEERGTALEGQV
jgi:hypothetical protein